MVYEHINRMCKCGNIAIYVLKGVISERDIRDNMDTSCIKCLQERCAAQCTCMSEWRLLTDTDVI